MRRVQAGETVAAAARDLLVGWQTVMRAVIAYGQPLVDDPDRLAGVAGLGVDEHVWTHASPSRRTGYATGIVDLTPGQPARLLDVVAGRSGQVYTDWIAEREQQWHEQIRRRARPVPLGVRVLARQRPAGSLPCRPAASPWLSVPLALSGCLLGASLGGGIGAGLKGACPAEPSNAVPTPASRRPCREHRRFRVGERGVAGVDPHKLSVTMAVVDPAGVEIDAASFDNTHAGRAAGEEWLAGLEVDILRIGVEGSSGHGRHLAKRLVAAGYDTREVPSRRTAERRRCRRRAKTDREDALALARATAGEPGWDRSSPAPASVTRTMSSSSYASIANCWSTGAPRCSITPRPRSPACPARSPTPCRRAAESIRGWPPSWRSTAGGFLPGCGPRSICSQSCPPTSPSYPSASGCWSDASVSWWPPAARRSPRRPASAWAAPRRCWPRSAIPPGSAAKARSTGGGRRARRRLLRRGRRTTGPAPARPPG